MRVTVACTYKQTRQGSSLDVNDQIESSGVVDVRFSLMPTIGVGSDNRASFAHMPSGEFTLNGLKPTIAEDIALGDIFTVELTKVPS